MNDNQQILASDGEGIHGGDIWGWSRRLGRPVGEILDLSASLNPLGPPPGLDQVLAETAGLLCHYPDRKAHDLRRAAALSFGVNPDNVLPGNGSTALIRLLARVLDLKNILVAAPAFGEFGRSLALSGRQFHYYSLSESRNFLPDTAEARKIWAENPSCFIISNPMTPSGGLVDRAFLEVCLHEAQQHRAWLILDEAFMDFVEKPDRDWALAQAVATPRVVVLRSLTKFYCLAGLRLGFALAHPDTLALLARLGEPWSVNTMAQAAGVFCLAQDEYAALSREKTSQWRGEMAASLSGLGFTVFPSLVNYLLTKLPVGAPSAAEISERCGLEGVLVRDASSFAGCCDRHLRFAVADPAGQKRLLAALEKALK